MKLLIISAMLAALQVGTVSAIIAGCASLASNTTCLAAQNGACGWCQWTDKMGAAQQLCLKGGPFGPEMGNCCDLWTHHNAQGANDADPNYIKCGFAAAHDNSQVSTSDNPDHLSGHLLACAGQCNGAVQMCKSDMGCKAALKCVAHAFNTTGGNCDDSCVTACINMGPALPSASITALQNTVSCLRQTCVYQNSTECVPSQCDAVRANCTAYPGCANVIACIQAVHVSGAQCNQDCISTCVSMYPTGQPPLSLVMEIAGCYHDHGDSCSSHQNQNVPPQYRGKCQEQCSDPFDACSVIPSCLASLTCFYNNPNCTVGQDCYSQCYSLTADGSAARAALSAALLCQADCGHSSTCEGLSNSDCSSNSQCKIANECKLIVDSCDQYSTSATCASPCQWDTVRGSCFTPNPSCGTHTSPADCSNDPICQWNDKCTSQSCMSTCRQQFHDCQSNNNCLHAANCLQGDHAVDVCRNNVTHDNAGLQKFEALALCSSQCNGTSALLPSTQAPIITESNNDASTCPSCLGYLTACKSDPNCHKALKLVETEYAIAHFCDSDCIAEVSALTSINSTTIALLTSTVDCYMANCTTCSGDCSVPLNACQADTACNAGLAYIKANGDANGHCYGSCLSGGFALVASQSFSRALLAEAIHCWVRCTANRDCATSSDQTSCELITPFKVAEAASCQWNARCVSLTDTCRGSTSESACNSLSICQWDGVLCHAAVDMCNIHPNQTDCATDSGHCRWSTRCRAQRDCVDTCQDAEAACLQYDSCLSALQCLRAAATPDQTHADQCAATYSLSADVNAQQAFDDFTTCFLNCHMGKRCDNHCSDHVFACESDQHCNKFSDCFSNCNNQTCTAACINAVTGSSSSRALATKVASCYDQCASTAQCNTYRTQSSCSFTPGCAWSSRCIYGDTNNCAQFTTLTDCQQSSVAQFCSWDSFSSICIGNADTCYSSSQLTPTAGSSGDFSLTLIGDGTCSNSSCHAENICLNDNRCDRLCYNDKQTCMNSAGCTSAYACLQDCEHHDRTCYANCLSGLSTNDKNTLSTLVSCEADCGSDRCGASCASLKTSCKADGSCATALSCIITHVTYGGCDSSCFAACAGSLSGSSLTLFNSAAGCFYQNCDNYFIEHTSCTAISANDNIPASFQQYLCQNTNCLSASQAGGSAVGCSWNATLSECGCGLADPTASSAYCSSTADACFECCKASHNSCKKTKGYGACSASFSACATQCAPMLNTASHTKDKVTLNFKLNITVPSNMVNNLDIDGIQTGIHKGLNNSNIQPTDVYVTGTTVTANSARRTVATSSVTVNYVVSVSSDGTASVVASSSNDLTSSISSSTGVPLTNAQVTSLGITIPTTVAPSVVVTTYLVVSQIITLPAGAYLTTAQSNQLITNFINAYALPLNTAVTIQVINGVVTAQFSVSSNNWSGDVSPRVVLVTYTNANSSTSSAYSTTTSQSAASTSTSNSNVVVIAAPVAAGGALVLIVLIVVLVLRAKNRVRSL